MIIWNPTRDWHGNTGTIETGIIMQQNDIIGMIINATHITSLMM